MRNVSSKTGIKRSSAGAAGSGVYCYERLSECNHLALGNDSSVAIARRVAACAWRLYQCRVRVIGDKENETSYGAKYTGGVDGRHENADDIINTAATTRAYETVARGQFEGDRNYCVGNADDKCGYEEAL